jgi:hypothetical protein
MASYVVDYARLDRIKVTPDPGYSFGTKLYAVLAALCLIFLFKRWRDKKLSSSKLVSDSQIIYPSEPGGL